MKLKTFLIYFFSLFAAFQFPIDAVEEETRQEALEREAKIMLEKAERISTLYDLPEGQDLMDITDRLLASPYVFEEYKESIISSGRQIFVFTYPSDGLKIKAFISFVPGVDRPVVMLQRGGNKKFGLPNPANDLSTFQDNTVICTSLRGGISEGQDEFGGADVNDVKNLVEYFSELEKKLKVNLQNQKMYMVAYSRGGMEMFLALARFPELQNRVAKIVSLSGMLDMRHNIEDRSDMKEMFIEDFGLNETNYEEWINLRDPLLTASKIRPDLPILIVQGTADIRVTLEEGFHMVDALQAHGSAVIYWEFDGGEHCLRNRPDILELVFCWLES